MAKVTKAGKILAVAFAAFKRGEQELAKDIFILAAEEKDAPEVMGPAVGEEAPPAKDPEVLKAEIAKALQDGDMEKAQSAMEELKSCMAPAQAEPPPAPAPAAPPAVAAEPPPAPAAPAAPAAAEEEPPAQADDELELPPAQIASLVKIAKKIKAAGHADLAEKITAALTK